MIEQNNGLTSAEVQSARKKYGSNELSLHKTSVWQVLWRQLNSPLLLILTVTTLISYGFGDHVNAGIIFGIMMVSISLGFFNEFSSERTVGDLLKKVSLSAVVIRNGIKEEVRVSEVVMGDLVILHQGTVIPADLELLEANELLINEATLTGEANPERKIIGDSQHHGRAYMGTIVQSGSGLGVVRQIASKTEFGRLSTKVTEIKSKTAFQKGLNELTTLMTKVITVMAVLICVLNIGLGRPPLEALMFALAVAIGLTPALLPVIVTVSMARGAHRMAKKSVIVKQLVNIEDLGNIQILCTDKTGTLTDGKIKLIDHFNVNGETDLQVLEMGLYCNTAAVHHKVMGNPMDVAIWEHALEQKYHLPKIKKVAEEEFNFDHRGEMVVFQEGAQRYIVFKGAPDQVMERCKFYRDSESKLKELRPVRQELREAFHRMNQDGLRLIAVARAKIAEKAKYGFEDAQNMEFLGYMTFLDKPKSSAAQAINHLKTLGVEVKIITGDNEIVTRKICNDIGFKITGVLTGAALERLPASEIEDEVLHANVFARVSPEQKEQIILALKKAKKVVGFMGDGINDAAALHAADVGISVNTAVDVAKDVAGVVLLKKGLDVIAEGVQEGRRIFANTIKYILMGTSSNFGNMFSVAGISFFLPFLPMTASQILLNNCLYDFSQLGLPSDEVDEEVLSRPQLWNIRHIYRYMLFFGPISSIFDYLSFALLWFVFRASESQFQTGWFLESILTQVLVVFVIRTQRRPFYKSRPGWQLVTFCLAALSLAFILPFTPVASALGFSLMPSKFYLALLAMVVTYLGIVEFIKIKFLQQVSKQAYTRE